MRWFGDPDAGHRAIRPRPASGDTCMSRHAGYGVAGGRSELNPCCNYDRYLGQVIIPKARGRRRS